MQEYSKRAEILKEIGKLRDQYQIVYFIEDKIPNELLDNEEFIEQLKDANPKTVYALEILNREKEDENRRREMEETEITDEELRNIIESESNLASIPKRYSRKLYEIAEGYEESGEYENAKKAYSTVVKLEDSQVHKFNERYGKSHEDKDTIYYKSKYNYYICKIKNGEELTNEDKKKIEKLIQEDKNNVLQLINPGKLTTVDVFLSYFKELPIENEEEDILNYIQEVGSKPRSGKGGTPSGEKGYKGELSAENRIKKMVEKFKIERVRLGKDKFDGTLIFELEDSDIIILEKFFESIKSGIEATGAATYMVHKAANLDLTKLSRSQLSEIRKGNKDNDKKLVDKANHSQTGYYTNFFERFDKMNELVISLEEQESILKIEEKDSEPVQVEEEQPVEEFVDVNEKTSGEEVELVHEGDIELEVGENPAVDKIEELVAEDVEAEEVDDLEDKEDERSDGASEVKKVDRKEELLIAIQKIDQEYMKYQEDMKLVSEETQRLEQKIEKLKVQCANSIDEILTDEMIQNIQQGFELLEKLKEELKEIIELEEVTREQAEENRKERDKLAKELKEIIRGEE